MKLTIDSEARTLTVEEDGDSYVAVGGMPASIAA